jgi:hypothetical protein
LANEFECFPADRVWPQKCDRCLRHTPESLECSEPLLNTRKRGPNSLRGVKREHPSILERPESQLRERDDDSSSDNASVYDRPAPTSVVSSEPVPENLSPTISNQDQFPASVYLPLGEDGFRILQLAPGRKDDPIVCSFATVFKNQPLEYEAISYLWGVPQKSEEITLLDPQGLPWTIHTRRNVFAALQSLRHPKFARSFWADALCINHSNKDEKNRLIATNQFVFHNAASLCFWLGEDESSKAALNFIPRILDMSGIHKLIRDDNAVESWSEFVGLLKNPIFSRLWLLQEVSVARNTTLHCRQAAIHYTDLVDATAIFITSRNELSLLYRRNRRNYKELFDRRITMAEGFINVTTNALRITNSGKIERQFTLEDLVSQLCDLASTDPLDRIYSVLTFARDGPQMGDETPVEYIPNTRYEAALRVDYSKSVLEVYQNFVIHAIERSGSLDIICRHWASSVSDSNLPTWVHPLQASHQPNSDISERINADSLVGLPGQSYYNASRGTVAYFRVGLNPSYYNAKSLFVPGFRIDTISKLGPRAEDGIILHEWLELGDVVGETVPEAFWRTLVADRSPNGSVAPSWYNRAFLYCLGLSPTGNINTNRLIDESEAEPSLTIDFLQRAQSVIWNRKFLVSKKNDWIGLAPMASQVGDEIFILRGCTVPVVLRRQEEGDGNKFFQLVGECYVHGMMDGEVAEIATAIEEEIELR